MLDSIPAFLRPFCRALTAPGPELPPASDIYAPLLGSWAMEMIDYSVDGTQHVSSGEWHFSRVLEGRGIQDVLIAPPRRHRSRRDRTGPENRYGSSIRIYEPESDDWRLTWFNPVTGVESHLIGRKEGDRIVQVGSDSDGAEIRWTFEDVTPTSFHWTGESSVDNGKTWRLEAEFHARRCDHDGAVDFRHQRREVMWFSPGRDRFEHVRLVDSDDGFQADGLIVRERDGGDLCLRYRICGDRNWRVRALEIESLDPDSSGLILTSDGDGSWFGEDGKPQPQLDGCQDVDLQASPFTNTIAIRRLALADHSDSEIRVVFVGIPDFGVVPARQRYTRLASDGPVTRYRYQGLDTDFEVELLVDADGLLHEYPGYFQRAWPVAIDHGGRS